MAVVTREKPTIPPDFIGGRPGDGDEGPGGEGSDGRPVSTAQLGLWLFMLSVTMLFAGIISAFMILRSKPEWQAIPTPSLLWWNTGLLALSSAMLELARRPLRAGSAAALRYGLLAATALGAGFLWGQLEVWQQLRDAGMYLPTHPHSSFFYVLTGLHALHLAGGLAVLLYVLALSWRRTYSRRLHQRFNLCAVYWHYLGGLWVALFYLFLGK